MKLCFSASKGFAFQCTQCGLCCSHDADGHIFIYWDDVKKISSTLGLSYEKFARRYLALTDYDFTLWDETLEKSVGHRLMKTLVLNFSQRQDCVFLFKKKGKYFCRVYTSRPFQCELYPFWSMIMTEEATFHDHKKSCPGFQNSSNATPFYTPQMIEGRVQQERKIERDYYLRMKQHDFDIKGVYPFLKKIPKLRINK